MRNRAHHCISRVNRCFPFVLGGIVADFCSLPQYNIRVVALYRPTLTVPALLSIVTDAFLFFNISIWGVRFRRFWAEAGAIINVALFVSEPFGCTSCSILASGVVFYAALFSAMGLLVLVSQAPRYCYLRRCLFGHGGESHSLAVDYPPSSLRSVPLVQLPESTAPSSTSRR